MGLSWSSGSTEQGFHVNTSGRVCRIWDWRQIVEEGEEVITDKHRTLAEPKTEIVQWVNFKRNKRGLYTYWLELEKCVKKQWNMSLRLRRQAVVRPMDLALTGVNSKVAQTEFYKKAQRVTRQGQDSLAWWILCSSQLHFTVLTNLMPIPTLALPFF